MFVFIHVVSNPHSWGPYPRERNDIRTHFLFEGSGQTLSPHSPETSGMWDKTRLQQATSLKDRPVCQSAESSFVLCEPVRRRWQLTFVLEISCPVLGKGLDKVHRGAVAPLPHHPVSSSSLPPSLLPATRIPTGHISHPLTNYSALCVDEEWSDWLCRGCLEGQSCVHFTLCPFGLPPAAPSERSHGQQKKKSRESGRKVAKRKTNRRKRENSSVCSLHCVMISCLGNRKCVMFSDGLKFTLTPAGTSSAAAQHSLYCKTVCCQRLHNKRRRSEPECLCCVRAQWEGTVFPLGKVC